MSRPELVLFDLDDTLYDHSHSLEQALEALRQKHPPLRSRPVDRLVEDYNRLLARQHPRVLDGTVTRNQARLERYLALFRSCGIEPDPPLLEAARETARAAYLESQRAVPGAAELLGSLRSRATVGIVTSNPLAEQQEKLRTVGLDGLVDFMLASEQTGCRKPDTRIIAQALGSIPPGRAVMVGDSWDLDIVCGLAAGVRCVWLNRSGRPCPEPLTAVELPSFIPLARALRAFGFDAVH